METAIRILIVDDHMLFAEAIRTMLHEYGLHVLGIACSGSQALDMARRDAPDVALVDIGLPDKSGLIVGSELMVECPEAKIIALTALDDSQVVKEAVRLGFHGYLMKDASASQFISAIQAVIEGQAVFSHRLGRRAAADRTPAEREAALLAQQLSPRELEVLEHLADGASGRQIAAALHISPNTVRTHVQSILTKLQVHSRLQAVAFAVRHELVKRSPNDRH
ncbi:MAG TPA: response regulator transcription factor [Actinomycetota bacterium]